VIQADILVGNVNRGLSFESFVVAFLQAVLGTVEED
jgi:hypothetical protein